MALTKLEKLLLPGVMLLVELILIVIFGLLVEYDDGGSAGHEYEVAVELANRSGHFDPVLAQDYILRLESTRTATKVYPCKFNGVCM